MTATEPTAVIADRDVVPPGHVGVSDVIRSVGVAVRRAYPASVWVKGEVSDYRPITQGHHYFSLVERLRLARSAGSCRLPRSDERLLTVFDGGGEPNESVCRRSAAQHCSVT